MVTSSYMCMSCTLTSTTDQLLTKEHPWYIHVCQKVGGGGGMLSVVLTLDCTGRVLLLFLFSINPSGVIVLASTLFLHDCLLTEHTP